MEVIAVTKSKSCIAAINCTSISLHYTGLIEHSCAPTTFHQNVVNHCMQYHMVIVRETKSSSCVNSINCTSTVLYSFSAVQHRYGRGCTCSLLYQNVDIY